MFYQLGYDINASYEARKAAEAAKNNPENEQERKAPVLKNNEPAMHMNGPMGQ